MAKNRAQLSFLILKTQKIFGIFAIFLCAIFGFLYLFFANQMLSNGYFLTKISEKNRQIILEIEKIDARIAQLESREFILNNKKVKNLPTAEKEKFLILSKKSRVNFSKK